MGKAIASFWDGKVAICPGSSVGEGHDWQDNDVTGYRTCARCARRYRRPNLGPCAYCGLPVWKGEWGSECSRVLAHSECADEHWERVRAHPRRNVVRTEQGEHFVLTLECGHVVHVDQPYRWLYCQQCPVELDL